MKVDYNNLVPGSVDIFALSAALPLPAYAPPEAPIWPVLPPSGGEEADLWTPLEPGVVSPPQIGTDALSEHAPEPFDPAWGLDGLMTDARLLPLGLAAPGTDGLAADLAAFGPATFHPMTGADGAVPVTGSEFEPAYLVEGVPLEMDATDPDPVSDDRAGLEVWNGAFDDGAAEIGFEDPSVYDWAGDDQLLGLDAFEHPDFVAAD